ncbi:MAG: peptidoglycan-binding protein [Cyanobacteria bacterium REEB459]|nr:peptidoglycan-binding protein [Cyanobacteria bacterium REEB459]
MRSLVSAISLVPALPGWLWLAALPMLMPVPLAIAQTSPDLNANPVVSGNRIIRPTLRLGSQGESVKELQSMLVLLGYYSGPVTGLYQEDTQLAVQRFQTAAGIAADGIVGPTTWNQLLPAPMAEVAPPRSSSPAAKPTTPSASSVKTPAAASEVATWPVLRSGMSGEAVRQLQQKLRQKGLYQGPVDGVFGTATEAAVRALQQAHNLTVDGIVGAATWKLL